ncbi:penicillin-binding protein [Actinospica durhamensis]|uniref:Penicillin-binding protein n=1 Tax=Actinospica durhamensis TaxID=1508375 RepID=A0A941EVE1_9ACTN|nr:transglycosylase domain-containing protein [Actinospica durhamensis]MBR7837953.1 penicillin-binding protein [Actinospica durhamensis]
MARPGGVRGVIRSLGKFVAGLIAFVVISALGGALVAGMALPAVAAVGLSAKAASDHFLNLSADFQAPNMPQRNAVEDAAGEVMATTWDPDNESNRVVVPLSQINILMQHAIVAIEDQRFYQHGGIDWKGTIRALVNNEQGSGSLQGGSDIAQQYIKNSLELEAGTNETALAAAQADTLTRKLQELRYATSVLQQMSRSQLLQGYLNLIPFGNDSFGVETAAETYFDTTAAKLDADQAALLAAVVNSPTADDPFNHAGVAWARRNVVLEDMAKQGYLTEKQAQADEAQPLNLKPGDQENGCIAAGSKAFFCTYVYNSFIQDPAYGATVQARENLWNQGGLVIKTTLVPQDQYAAQRAVNDHTHATDKVATALAMVVPGSGAITAIAQSKPMGSGAGQTYVDLAADTGHGGGEGYQAGSSFKIFEGLAALEDGWNPDTVMSVPSPLVETGNRVPVCVDGARPTITWPGSYMPNNDNDAGFTGTLPEAYWFSVNTYFLTLETETGLCLPATIAQAMGVTLDNDTGTGKPLGQFPSFTLGTNLITPIEMAAAYATLAAHGEYCRPYVIADVRDLSGKQYPAQNRQCAQVLDANVANELTAMLRGVLTVPGATADGLGIGRPAAGKTGTTTQSIATWFDGFTPQLATAVWTGFVSPKAGDFLGYMSIGGHYWDQQIFGATISAPTWQQAMEGALQGQPVEDFTQPYGYPPVPSG